MGSTSRDKDAASLVDRVAARLERLFKPLVGGAEVTPYVDRPEAPRPQWTCPACGQPLGAHRLDESVRGRMYCPRA